MGRDYDKWPDEYDEIDPWEDDEKPPPSEKKIDYDSRNIRYNRNAGSQSPTKGRCNALLRRWNERYDEPRYCTRVPEKYFNCEGNSDFCKKHKGIDGLMQRASDIMDHGMFTKSFVHYFDKADPFEKVLIIGLFESLIDESIYDFEEEIDSLTLDFSESEYDVDEVGINTDEDGEAVIGFPQPTNRSIRALALLEASVDEVKMLKANSDILDANMRTESVSVSATTEDGRIGETLEEYNEHYLNLPYSRLVKDHKENLKRGGVDIEGVEAEEGVEAVKRTFSDKDLPKVGDEDEPASTSLTEDSTEDVFDFVDQDELEAEDSTE